MKALARSRSAGRLIASSLVVLVLAACGGGGTSSSTSSSASSDDSGSVSPPNGVYSGRDTYPMTFTVKDGVITGLHGSTTLYCAGGPKPISQISQFSDQDSIDVDSNGGFSDDYQYAVGNGTWTLHVEGTLTSDGTATGFDAIQGIGCSAGRNGWAAALPDAQLPTAPPSPSPSAAVACSPEPCQTLHDVTLSVQSATVVTKSDDPSTQGVDVDFSVSNDSAAAVIVRNGDFSLKFGNGDTAQTGYLDFVDGSGRTVSCFSGQVTVPAGQQIQDQHLCLTLPNDESGQQMTLVWVELGPAFSVSIGQLQ